MLSMFIFIPYDRLQHATLRTYRIHSLSFLEKGIYTECVGKSLWQRLSAIDFLKIE